MFLNFSLWTKPTDREQLGLPGPREQAFPPFYIKKKEDPIFETK
jgi:hypothetical protein